MNIKANLKYFKHSAKYEGSYQEFKNGSVFTYL